MSRLQLALNVADIDQAVTFYERLFATPVAKRREGYANFEIADPPLKLVLFERPDATERLNHLGVEVESPALVRDHEARLRDEGLDTVSDDGTCCHAVQDKTWVTGPDGDWEIYTVLADAPAPVPAGACSTSESGVVCCT